MVGFSQITSKYGKSRHYLARTRQSQNPRGKSRNRGFWGDMGRSWGVRIRHILAGIRHVRAGIAGFGQVGASGIPRNVKKQAEFPESAQKVPKSAEKNLGPKKTCRLEGSKIENGSRNFSEKKKKLKKFWFLSRLAAKSSLKKPDAARRKVLKKTPVCDEKCWKKYKCSELFFLKKNTDPGYGESPLQLL